MGRLFFFSLKEKTMLKKQSHTGNWIYHDLSPHVECLQAGQSSLVMSFSAAIWPSVQIIWTSSPFTKAQTSRGVSAEEGQLINSCLPIYCFSPSQGLAVCPQQLTLPGTAEPMLGAAGWARHPENPICLLPDISSSPASRTGLPSLPPDRVTWTARHLDPLNLSCLPSEAIITTWHSVTQIFTMCLCYQDVSLMKGWILRGFIDSCSSSIWHIVSAQQVLMECMNKHTNKRFPFIQ